MANNKIGLNYYNVDTDRYQDIKIKRLKKDFGCSGIAVYDYILCEIYRVKGCFTVWDENRAFDVAEYFGIKESLVSEIVNACGIVGLFDRGLLTRVQILTSLPIQKRYLDFCTKAKRANCEIPKNIIIQEESHITPEVCDITPEESHITPEVCREVKRSEVKRNKKGLEKTLPPLIPEIVKPPISKKQKQPDALQFPFCSQKFIEAWEKLIQMPKWKKKLPMSLQMSLDKLAKYDEDFAIELISRAIAGDYQGITFSNTDEDFLKWKTAKGKTGKILQPNESRKQVLLEKFEANAN